MNVGIRLVSNDLPDWIGRFQRESEWAEQQAAERIKEAWRWDVRVSRGSGNYTEAMAQELGGDPGHYRDNVYWEQLVPEEDGERGWRIYTPVPYSKWNEFGGGPLTPKPSAAMAAEAGVDFIAEEFVKAFLS